VYLFLEVVDLLKQADIFFHVLCILLLVLRLIGDDLSAAVLDHGLTVVALLRCRFLVVVGVIVDALVEHVHFIQFNDLLLKRLELGDVGYRFKNILVEVLLQFLLLLYLRHEVAAFARQTLLTH